MEPGGAGVARDRGQRAADVVGAHAASVDPGCACDTRTLLYPTWPEKLFLRVFGQAGGEGLFCII